VISRPLNPIALSDYVSNPTKYPLKDGRVQSVNQYGYRFWNMSPIPFSIFNEMGVEIEELPPWSYVQGTVVNLSRYLLVKVNTTVVQLAISGVTSFSLMADTQDEPLAPMTQLLSYSQIVQNSVQVNTVQPVFLHTLFDNSGTIATANTSQQLLAASSKNQRSYILIQNLAGASTTDYLYVNWGQAAAIAQGSILIAPGKSLIFEDFTVPQQAIYGISGTAGLEYTLKYGGN
jgi:hypothetical protein